MIRTLTLTIFSVLILSNVFAQTSFETALKHLETSGKYTAKDLADIVISGESQTKNSGVTHLYLKQRFEGIEIEGSQTNFNFKNETILSYGERLFSNVEEKANSITPALTASEALQKVLDLHEIDGPIPTVLEQHTSSDQKTTFLKGSIAHNAIDVNLIFIAQGETLRLCWKVNFYEKTCQHAWLTFVDANTGLILDEFDQVIHCTFHSHKKEKTKTQAKKMAEITLKQNAMVVANSYNVYAYPVESPNHGGRTLQIEPWLDAGGASSIGWHDDGTTTYTHTKGNNVDAYHDHDANNSPTGGNAARADGGANLEFDFPIDLTQDPDLDPDPYITNLFYWSNLMHDVWYQYGFDEASGNFQEDNLGEGGTGGDYLDAEAQDGSGMNNATMFTPVDGSNPRMQMFLWRPDDPADPDLDSDLDNAIIAHEFGHGISIRLTGGPDDVGCVNNAEQMGEGWSDWFGIWMTIEPGDNHADSRGVGTYVEDEDPDGDGIRLAPYTTDFEVNDYTYGDVSDSGVSQPHGIGFIWCTMIWDLNWALVNNAGGLDLDLYNGTGGNNYTAQIIIDAMKLQTCDPGFVDARDAILDANVNNGGEFFTNVIWNVFARRGLGFSASQGDPNNRFDQVEAFDLPDGVPMMTYEELFGAIPLPVEMTFFNAVEDNDKQLIELVWATASETNSRGFDLQRMQDGDLDFESIAWVDSEASNDFAGSTYFVNDQDVKAGTTYFYRLKQVDLDGKETYSEIVSAKLRSTENDIQVFPNPTYGISSVKFPATTTGVVDIKIMDALGQFVGAKIFETNGDAEIEINLTNQTEGVYFLNIEANGQKTVKRIVLKK